MISKRHQALGCLGLALCAGPLPAAESSIRFQEVSTRLGLDYVGQSFGTSWGDYDNDGWLDVWLVNHLMPPTLHKNAAGRTFRITTPEVFGSTLDIEWDTHGAAWVDVDNDGDLDFYQTAGGLGGASTGTSVSEANQLFLQDHGRLSPVGPDYGLSYTKARSRTPLWIDLDRDGRLDLILGLLGRPDKTAPVGVFRQRSDGRFEEAADTFGIHENEAIFATVADMTGDGIPDLVMPVPAIPQGLQIYDGSTLPYRKATTPWLPQVKGNMSDLAIADFDGDGRNDIYTTSGFPVNSGVRQHDARTITFGLQPPGEGQLAFRFKAGRKLRVDLGNWAFTTSYFLEPKHIRLGEKGSHPDNARVERNARYPLKTRLVAFTVEASQALGRAVASDEPFGVYLGFDADRSEWELRLVTPAMYTLTGIVASDEPITSIAPEGFELDPKPIADHLYLNQGTRLIDATAGSGIPASEIAGRGVVSGDFDNDMDVDLYIVQSSHWGNLPNTLLENLGGGHFHVLPGAGGAEGHVWGIGDTPSVADFDNDGFLDILVPNGNWPPMLEDSGRTELFRNVSANGNHWIEIDLEGTRSNRDAIGASVFVTAGGKRQVRHRGGMHRYTQDSPRLHFGLGKNATIDEIEILWPSGSVQKMHKVSADQILRVKEPAE